MSICQTVDPNANKGEGNILGGVNKGKNVAKDDSNVIEIKA